MYILAVWYYKRFRMYCVLWRVSAFCVSSPSLDEQRELTRQPKKQIFFFFENSITNCFLILTSASYLFFHTNSIWVSIKREKKSRQVTEKTMDLFMVCDKCISYSMCVFKWFGKVLVQVNMKKKHDVTQFYFTHFGSF